MKILKAGKPIKDRSRKATCDHCGCRFEVMESEIKTERDRNEDYRYVKCPQKGCNEIVYFR